MLDMFIVELLGTFFFLSVILITGSPIPIVVGLLASIYFSSAISGGHLNPAVSIMSWAKGDLDAQKLVIYIAAQVMGGLMALLWFKASGSKKVHAQ